ncbi:hypothetical protein FPOA_12753, partial [Fusarium poae]
MATESGVSSSLTSRPMCPDVAPNGTSDSLVPESTRFGDSRSEGPVNGKATELNDLGNALADTDTSDDDCRRFVISQEKPSTITEKKRLDNAAFRDWVVNTQREAMRNSLTAPDDLRNQSVSHLITASENRMIITTPREYQIELFERAKRENTIVVLPTGSGKTLIAALLLRHYLEQELEDRATGNPKRVAFFVVEKVALCFQQFAVLNCNLGAYPVTKFWGKMSGTKKKSTGISSSVITWRLSAQRKFFLIASTVTSS